jgi:hypothetical protein
VVVPRVEFEVLEVVLALVRLVAFEVADAVLFGAVEVVAVCRLFDGAAPIVLVVFAAVLLDIAPPVELELEVAELVAFDAVVELALLIPVDVVAGDVVVAWLKIIPVM